MADQRIDTLSASSAPEVLSMLESESPGVNGRILMYLIEDRNYDPQFVRAAERLEASTGVIAVNARLAWLATAYLVFAGARSYDGDNDLISGLVGKYGGGV